MHFNSSCTRHGALASRPAASQQEYPDSDIGDFDDLQEWLNVDSDEEFTKKPAHSSSSSYVGQQRGNSYTDAATKGALDVLRNTDPKVRKQFIDKLSQTDSGLHAEHLAPMLWDGNTSVRLAAAGYFAVMGKAGARCSEILASRFPEERHPIIKAMIAEALVKMGVVQYAPMLALDQESQASKQSMRSFAIGKLLNSDDYSDQVRGLKELMKMDDGAILLSKGVFRVFSDDFSTGVRAVAGCIERLVDHESGGHALELRIMKLVAQNGYFSAEWVNTVVQMSMSSKRAHA